jgi:hypothetical protein
LFGLIVAAVLLALAEAGYRIGLRIYASKDEARRSQTAGCRVAIRGLMGLLLGFTFSMAVNRYEIRRAMVLKEANAVGVRRGSERICCRNRTRAGARALPPVLWRPG